MFLDLLNLHDVFDEYTMSPIIICLAFIWSNSAQISTWLIYVKHGYIYYTYSLQLSKGVRGLNKYSHTLLENTLFRDLVSFCFVGSDSGPNLEILLHGTVAYVARLLITSIMCTSAQARYTLGLKQALVIKLFCRKKWIRKIHNQDDSARRCGTDLDSVLAILAESEALFVLPILLLSTDTNKIGHAITKLGELNGAMHPEACVGWPCMWLHLRIPDHLR